MADFNIRNVNGELVKTMIEQYSHANTIEVEAGTTGFRGGDAGHGARTYFRIKDLGCTDMKITTITGGVVIELGGDAEIITFIKALEFAVGILKYKTEED